MKEVMTMAVSTRKRKWLGTYRLVPSGGLATLPLLVVSREIYQNKTIV
jgi:hypothetical protein